MFSCKYWEISNKPILKNICVRLLLKGLQEVVDQDFLSGKSLSKTSRLSSNITKKPEPSLNLTPTLYIELRFPIFIINGYDRKANACSPWASCCVCLKRVTLQLPVFFLLFFCQPYPEYQGIRSKKLFYRPLNSQYSSVVCSYRKETSLVYSFSEQSQRRVIPYRLLDKYSDLFICKSFKETLSIV